VNAEFNWWLLIVGIVVGAGLTFLVISDLRPSDEELDDPAWQDETPTITHGSVEAEPEAEPESLPRPDQASGTRPTWSATDPSPRRR
jgi:hypothetical protein